MRSTVCGADKKTLFTGIPVKRVKYKNSAATYSPTQSPVQYHRRWRAVRRRQGFETGEDARQRSRRHTGVCGVADNEAGLPGSGVGRCRIISVFAMGTGGTLHGCALKKL